MNNRKVMIIILVAVLVLAGIFAITRMAGKDKNTTDNQAPQETTNQKIENNEEEHPVSNTAATPAPTEPAQETEPEETPTEAPTEAPTQAPADTPEPVETIEVQEEVEIVIPDDQDSEGF